MVEFVDFYDSVCILDEIKKTSLTLPPQRYSKVLKGKVYYNLYSRKE